MPGPWEQYQTAAPVANPMAFPGLPANPPMSPLKTQQLQRGGQQMGLDENQDARAWEQLQLQKAAEKRAQEKWDREHAHDALTGGVDTTEGEKTAGYLTTRIKASAQKIREINQKYPDAVQPGWMETVAGATGSERLKDLAIPKEVKTARIILNNRYRDVVDAALTLATGAAYTKEQMRDFTERLSPTVTDTPGSIADKRQQLLETIEAGRAKSGAGNVAIDQAIKSINEIYQVTDAGPEKAATAASTDSKIIPIPQAMKDEEAAFLAQHPRGSLSLEDYNKFRQDLDKKYNFPESDYSASPGTVKYIKAYNEGKPVGSIPGPERKLSGLEKTAAEMAGSETGTLIGNAANAATAGLPALLAGQGGRDALEAANATNPKAALAGDVIGSIAPIAGGAKAAIALGTKTPALADLVANIGYGGTRGLFESDNGSGASGAGLGALSGGLGSIAGSTLARGARGFMGAEKRAAVDSMRDTDLTTLQRMGFGKAEETASGLPIVRGGRAKSLESWNNAQVNRALAEVGEKLPKGTPAGTKANAKMNDILNAGYNEISPKIVGQPDKTWVAAYGALKAKTANDPLMRQLWDEGIASLQSRLLGKNGAYDGAAYKDVNERLRAVAHDWLSMESGTNASVSKYHEMGRLAEQVRKQLRELVKRNTPEVGQKLDKLDKAWAKSVLIEDATNRALANGDGIYSPSQLVTSIKKLDTSTRKGASARGRAAGQKEAEAARMVLGSGGVGSKASLKESLIGAGTLGGVGWFNPVIPALAGTSLAASYTPGVKRLTQLGLTAKRPGWIDNDQISALIASLTRDKVEGK